MNAEHLSLSLGMVETFNEVEIVKTIWAYAKLGIATSSVVPIFCDQVLCMVVRAALEAGWFHRCTVLTFPLLEVGETPNPASSILSHAIAQQSWLLSYLLAGIWGFIEQSRNLIHSLWSGPRILDWRQVTGSQAVGVARPA